MMKYTKIFTLCLILLLAVRTSLFSAWEMISPGRDIRNILVVENTWFGIERIQNGTIVQMLLVSSTDKGSTWNTNNYFSEVFQITTNKSRILLRATKDPGWGYFISDDKGVTWKKLTWPFTVSGSDIFLSDSAIFISVAKNPGVTSPVYRSLDNGNSFQPMDIDIGDRSFGFGYDFGNFSKLDNSIFVFVGRVGVFESNNNGDSWDLKNAGLPFTDSDYEYVVGVLSQGTTSLYMYFGDLYGTRESYRYQNGMWVLYQPDTYYYEPYYDDFVATSPIKPSPTASRTPYIFTVSNVYSNSADISYSVNDGKTWFKFGDTSIGTVYWSGILIDGGYIYVGASKGFARRRLAEAVNHTIKLSRSDINDKLPISPEEFKNLLNMMGPDALDELLQEYGYDSDDISNEELDEFISDYTANGGMTDDLFVNSQPGMCSYMGMPLWSVNVANLKLFVRDVLFRKKGIGPEVKLACNYIHSMDTTTGIFGRKWHFEYESMLLQKDSMVIITTGTGAHFSFTANAPITTGASSFSLPCINNEEYNLHWNGSTWIWDKNKGAELCSYQSVNDSLFVLSSLEDTYHKKITFGYNAQNQPVSITDGSGRIFSLTYNNGMCDSIVGPDGRFSNFTYSNKLLVSSTDFGGITTTYTYDSLLHISSADISGKLTRFEYSYDQDTTGMISVVYDPENRKIEYSSSILDSATILTSVTYPGSKTRTYKLQNGLVTTIINSLGESKNIYYNSQALIDSMVWYNGETVTFDYDGDNNIIHKKNLRNKVFDYTYDTNRNLLLATESSGDTLYAKTFNAKNQLVSIKLPGNTVTTFEYDSIGALSGIISPGGKHKTFTYDAFGNINSYTNPLGNTMSYNYDENGFFPVSRTDFMGNTYHLEYNENGRLTTITLPDGNHRTINYDCCTQTGFTDESGNTLSVSRDNTNRILSRNYAEGWSVNYDYDDNGFISGITNKYGMPISIKYNDNGLVISKSDENGSVIYNYNQYNQPESITDKKGNKTKFGYDSTGKLLEITDAANKKTTFDFGTDNRLASVTNARGQKMEFQYSEKGEVTGKKINSNTFDTYEYNQDGFLISFTDSSGTTKYTRNDLGFVTIITYPGNLEVAFVHDANGNITGITYPNGLTVINEVDELNRISGISWESQSVDFSYNPAGYMLSETRSNSTGSTYDYNKDNVLTKVIHFNNDTEFASETVKLVNGIITERTIRQTVEMTKTPEAILGAATNNLNQLVSTFNGYAFSYDADGNMISATNGAAEILKASYNHDNLLSSFTSGNEAIRVRYDAMRYPRRIISQSGTTNLFYDHKGRILFETDESNNVTRIYIYKGKRLIAMQTAQNQVYFYHFNRLGHVVALTDQNGNIVNKYSYSASGEILGKSESISNWFTFLGGFGALRLTDDYILTGARVYQPLTGRYIQRDPLGMITGTNPYVYARNNPVAGVDPLGLDDQEATVNTLDFDPPSDNDIGTAGGTANPYAEDLPYRSNDWDTYGSAAGKTIKDITNHPAFDLVPDFIALPVSGAKALDKLADHDIGGALWQFVPFNNSLEAAGDYIDEKLKKVDTSKSSGLGIFGDFNKNKTFSCDL